MRRMPRRAREHGPAARPGHLCGDTAVAGQELRADVRIVPVGNYAIQPEWSDGHHTGLYTWTYLRGLCPCDECRAAAPTGA